MAIRNPDNLDDDTDETISRIDDDIQETITVDDSGLSPKLVQEIDGEQRVEFDPLAVTRLGGTLAFETEGMQLHCGETVTESNGDQNIRLNFECVATQGQFNDLQQMRSNPEQVKLVSRAYSGPATFDQLKFDRVPDANGVVVPGVGTINDPVYTIQLQSKENSDTGSTLFDNSSN